MASRLFVSCWQFAEQLPKRDYFLRSQFLRAVLSIKLNIAEGAAEFSNGEKIRFYRMARRSVGECAAILDDLPAILGIDEKLLEPFYAELARISKKLLQLIYSIERRPQQSTATRRSKRRNNHGSAHSPVSAQPDTAPATAKPTQRP